MPTQSSRVEPRTSLNGGDVCAIVVTYHPDTELLARLENISPQVGMMVIVDNGSGEAEQAMLIEAAAHPKISLVLNPQNLGLAQALNIGIQRAVALQYSWVLLLDQDSRVDRDMVGGLLNVLASFPDPTRLAVLGANYCATAGRGSAATDPAPPAELWDDVDQVITSGSLLPLSTHASIGPFREEFFIDYVDEEYCLRARAKGYRVIRSRAQLMSHVIGAPTVHKTLWMSKWTTNHAPDRRYYIARNSTVLLREYGRLPAGIWALKSLGRCVRHCKRIALYERMKIRKIAAVFHGWWDGVRGHMGPRNTRAHRAGASAASGRSSEACASP